MRRIPFKRGDTFLLRCTLQSEGISDWSGWALPSAQVRYRDTLVSTLSAVWLDHAAGVYTLRADTTQAWPVGDLQVDVQYTSPEGLVVSTETFLVGCLADVTRSEP